MLLRLSLPALLCSCLGANASAMPLGLDARDFAADICPSEMKSLSDLITPEALNDFWSSTTYNEAELVDGHLENVRAVTGAILLDAFAWQTVKNSTETRPEDFAAALSQTVVTGNLVTCLSDQPDMLGMAGRISALVWSNCGFEELRAFFEEASEIPSFSEADFHKAAERFLNSNSICKSFLKEI